MDFLSTITLAYVTAFRTAQTSLVPYGLGFAFFFGLVAWFKAHGLELLRGGSFSADMLSTSLLLCLKLGLIVWTLQYGLSFAEACWQSALQLGSAAGGSRLGTLSTHEAPAMVLAMGFRVAQPLAEHLGTFSNWVAARSLTQSLVLTVAYLGIIASFALMAFEMTLILITFYLAVLTATVCVGFSLVAGVTHFAEVALGWLSGILIGVFVLSAFLGVGLPLFGEIRTLLTPIQAPNQLFAPIPQLVIEPWQALGATIIAGIFALMALVLPTAAGALGGRGIYHAVNVGQFGRMGGAIVSGVGGAIRRGASVIRGQSTLVR